MLELILLFPLLVQVLSVLGPASLLPVWTDTEVGYIREPHLENFSEQEKTLDQVHRTCPTRPIGLE